MKSFSFLASLRRVGLLLAGVVLVSGVLAAPTPAHASGFPTIDIAAIAQAVKQFAQDAANWAKQHAYLGQIISSMQTLYNTVTLKFDEVVSTIEKTGYLQLQSDKMQDELLIRLKQRELAEAWHRMDIQAKAEIARDRPSTPVLYKEICYKIREQQLGRNMRSFQRDLVRDLQRGLENEGRLLGDPSGPIAINAAWQNRCGKAWGDKGRGFVNPLDNPTDKKCTPADGPNKELTIDADISATTLTASIDRPPLDEPKTIKKMMPEGSSPGPKKEVELLDPQADSAGEMLFVAARDYCYNFSGIGLAPPKGKALDTPEGRKAMAVFSHNMAKKTLFSKQCLDRVTYLTRPNPEKRKDLFETSVLACKKYEKVKTEDGKTVLPDTVDCSKGLSPFQNDYLQHMKCTNSDQYVKKAAGGASANSLMSESNMCQTAMDVWLNKLAQEDAKLLQAAIGLQNMKN